MIPDHLFYEDEVRCDYLIPSMVKRTWAAQIEILADLDEACQKNGLTYFAEWGTLLGTIRHGGFIPLDDDVDICMKRKDYEFFISNASKILPENYSIVNYRSSRDFKQMLSRIVSSDHYRFDPEYLHKYSGLPFALGLDIFPLDFISDDEEYEKDRERRVRLVYDVVNEIAHFNTPLDRMPDSIRQIEKEFGIDVKNDPDVLTTLRDLLVKMFGEVEEKDAKYITMYPLWLNNHDFRFPAAWYSHSIRMRFEYTTIPVPVCYEEILRKKYGQGFMTPVRSGGAHEYPYYENHVNVLREHFGFEWPSYRFSEKDLCTPKAPEVLPQAKCLFITYGLREFENMRSLVRKYLDAGYDVSILPVTKFDIEPDMTKIIPSQEVFEDDFYLYDLPGARMVHDESVINGQFDIIVSNYPYDEYNLITTIDRKFYSGELRKKCDRLVYVPAYEPLSIGPRDERAKKLMPSYVDTPLVLKADEIVLHSDEMKQRYVECLDDFSEGRYKDLFEKKITVLSASKKDRADTKRGEKKKILFYIGISLFAAHGEKAIDKLREVFGIFDENADRVDVIFEVQENLSENLKNLFPDLYDRFRQYESRINTEETDIDEIDAYYGEASEYATMMMNASKPVMIYTVAI